MKRLQGKENFINLVMAITGLFGIYLILAWASYSQVDNAWSVASTATDGKVLNKTGSFGAWLIDLLYAFWGKTAFLIPFSLTGAAAYVLISRTASEFTLKQLYLRCGYFLLLMLGLSGLAGGLLSDSPYYLAGGFIGGLWQTLLVPHLGLFGMLLVAMLFTALGFYLCSAQSLIALGVSFYEWVTAKDEKAEEEAPAENDEPEQAGEFSEILQNDSLQNDLKNQPLESETKMKAETQFTDVSSFKRPNISGLRPADFELERFTEEAFEEEAEQLNPNETSTEAAMFDVRPTLDLPKVTVAGLNEADNGSELALPKVHLPIAEEYAPKAEENETELNVDFATQDPLFNAPFTITLPAENSTTLATEEAEQVVIEDKEEIQPSFLTSPPQIKLQSITEEENSEDFDAQRAAEFAEMEQQRLAEIEARAKAAGLEQVFHKITEGAEDFSTDLTAKVKIRTEPTPSVFSTPIKPANEDKNVTQQSVNRDTYPKGYGDTLIHPLLQKNKVLEKPTTPLPTLDLLAEHHSAVNQITEEEILATSRRIETALANYGVKATVEDVLVGPVVIRYEIKLAAGVKAAKVTSLASDLARELMFKAIRITEFVPGKPYMGIETPNKYRETVWLRDVLASDEFVHSEAALPMVLGKDISGTPFVIDMTKTPHLLVAGQTGGGKSVGLNTMILSLLFKLTPEQVRFIMIDPKMVELSMYRDIPHLLTPVVTDMKKAANALRWVVDEMERRYLLINHLSVRTLESYNAKIDQAVEMGMPIADPTWQAGSSMDSLPPPLEKLNYIVLIIDEFADLMMTAGKEIEEYIMRIAQKARAVGIHLILATQRPSTDVITGVVKASLPSRIAFTVASQIDSRTILDTSGAESLLGRGDMLYSGSGSPELVRIHGAFIEDDEVSLIADNWRARGKPQYLDNIVNEPETNEGSNRSTLADLDPLFDEVVEFIIETGITSISGIQRRFSLGFNRAARIIDQVEAQGIISEADKGKKREILAR